MYLLVPSHPLSWNMTILAFPTFDDGPPESELLSVLYNKLCNCHCRCVSLVIHHVRFVILSGLLVESNSDRQFSSRVDLARLVICVPSTGKRNNNEINEYCSGSQANGGESTAAKVTHGFRQANEVQKHALVAARLAFRTCDCQ